MLTKRLIRNPTDIIGVMAARGGNLDRKLLPPTVKRVQVTALKRIRKSPKLEDQRNTAGEKSPWVIMRETPKNPRKSPVIFRSVIGSERKKQAVNVMKSGWAAMIHPVWIAVV
jgi:hypothetical protein